MDEKFFYYLHELLLIKFEKVPEFNYFDYYGMQNIPFSIPKVAFLSFVVSIDNYNYTLEFVFDIANVTEHESSSDVALFSVSINYSLTVSPASSKNIVDTTVVPCAVLNAKATSFYNSKTYSISVQIAVNNLRIEKDFDAITEMPIVTPSLLITLLSIKECPHEMLEVFKCNYCGHFHSVDWYSEEHIIPKAMKNANYVLPNSCKRLNNYMANSFEKHVLQFEALKEVFAIIEPPNKPIFRAHLKPIIGKDIAKWILPSGLAEYRKIAEYSKSDSIILQIKGANGENHAYTLKLPFTIIDRISGHENNINLERFISRSIKQLEEYLKELSNNPNLNPDFANFLLKVGGTFTFNKINPEVNRIEHDIEIPQHTQTFLEDNEVLFKLFLKIAWTHCCKQLGVENMENPIAKWILTYLSTGHITDKNLINTYPELFSSPLTIDGKEFVFWKYGLDETVGRIELMPEEIDKDDLIRYHNYRSRQFIYASNLISFNGLDTLEDDDKKERNRFNYHNLSLTTFRDEEQQVTVCSIELFGELFDVAVKITNKPITENYPHDVKILF